MLLPANSGIKVVEYNRQKNIASQLMYGTISLIVIEKKGI
ncbi:hypothetical protein EMIT019CA3_70026 [Bacillus pseudomycoides]